MLIWVMVLVQHGVANVLVLVIHKKLRVLGKGDISMYFELVTSFPGQVLNMKKDKLEYQI